LEEDLKLGQTSCWSGGDNCRNI